MASKNKKKKTKAKPFFVIETPKDIKKIVRVIAELIILAVLAFVIVRAWTSFQVYKPFDEAVAAQSEDHGFIAVSYNAVERAGSRAAIGVDLLDKHLKALYDSGYQTISQQDVIDYYAGGKPLPEKALLLLFEDANREASIFAQKIMEEYNFKATIVSYGDGFTKGDPKLLNSDDMLRMEKSTFWEIGTSGYRMKYINVFDKDGNYLGEMDSLTLNGMRQSIGNDYDHYLMDYLRDANRLPLESYEGMVRRVQGEYEKTREAFESEIGYMPALYALVTPNSGAFGHNEKVSAVNAASIYESFAINLNRLGFCSNDTQSSIYDLTRTQPQPYWPVNHLLMRVWSDTGQPSLAFTRGDAERAAFFSIYEGAAEFDGDRIILTSLPYGAGRARLADDAAYGDVEISVGLEGNKLGSQSILLRMDESLTNGLAVTLKNNVLYAAMLENGVESVLASIDLNFLDGYDEESVVTNLAEAGSRKITISLIGDTLSVAVGEKPALTNVKVPVSRAGHIGLLAETTVRTVNERIPVDNIYDGIFQKLVISAPGGDVLFDNAYGAFDAAVAAVSGAWRAVIDWFITNL